MESVRTISLGENPEQQIANMKTIVECGFPDGVVAFCWECSTVREFTTEQAARHITEGTWPTCHGRMDMGGPDDAPRF